MQDKANLLEGEFVLSAVQKERYEKSPAFGDASKQSQFLRRQENRWGKPHPTTARQRRAHCVSRYNSDFEMGDERGSDVILCAHCVSVVKNSRKGRRLLDRIMQNKANLVKGEFVLSAVQKERYEKSPAFGDASKQSQFLRRQENRWGKPHPTTARQRRAHCVSRYNSDFEMGDERGSDVILCAHCVSVVKNSRKGRRLLDRIMQNKANLVKGEVVLTAVQTERYGTFPAFGARQNKPNLPAGVAVCAAGGAMCEVSSARSEGSSSEPSDFRLHTPSETPYGVTTSGGGA
ncbi:MAG: hypothetical protein A2Y76_12740 [Planctomycetes bacterium RBG_13_60_9]|nr:MAG: hypothetical protein A2Y76_12740 [Planctomycetes bacterium RBG_13_60_9]